MFLYFTQYQWMWKMYSHKKIISCKFTNSFYWKYKVWSVQTLRIKDQPNQKPAFSFVLSLIHWGRVFCLHIESSVTELSLTDVHHGQFVAAMPFHICKPYLRSAVSSDTQSIVLSRAPRVRGWQIYSRVTQRHRVSFFIQSSVFLK